MGENQEREIQKEALGLVEEHVLRKRLRNESKDKRELAERLNIAEARLDLLTGLHRQSREPEPIVRREKRSRVHEATAVLVCSDWHVEEQVDPDEVQGLNNYNPDIARARVERLLDGFLWLYDLHHGKKFRVDRVSLLFLGDMISGWIHDELIANNAMAPPPAVLLFEDLAKYLLTGILEETDVELDLVAVPGNHGRLNHRPHIKGKGLESLEWVAYAHLAAWLRERYGDRVRVHVSLGSMEYVDAYGYLIRCIHGDGIKYSGGIGGYTVPLNKAIFRWDTARRAHVTMLGHFHHFNPGPKHLGNGCLIGFSEYPQFKAFEYEPPTQAFSLIDSRYGRVADWKVLCTESRELGTDPRILTPGEREVRRQQRGETRKRWRIGDLLTVDGVTKTVREWADESPVKPKGLVKRLNRGWNEKRAVFEEAKTDGGAFGS